MDLATKPNILNAFSKPNLQEEYRGKGDDGKKLILLEEFLETLI